MTITSCVFVINTRGSKSQKCLACSLQFFFFLGGIEFMYVLSLDGLRFAVGRRGGGGGYLL